MSDRWKYEEIEVEKTIAEMRKVLQGKCYFCGNLTPEGVTCQNCIERLVNNLKESAEAEYISTGNPNLKAMAESIEKYQQTKSTNK